MKRPTAAEVFAHFDLAELPVEGGYFRQTYLSKESLGPEVLPARYRVEKPFGTAILFLLNAEPDCFSALHKLDTDEVYHYYLGDPMELLLLYPDGAARRVILGQDILNGQHIQFVVPRDVWQGSRLIPGGEFALIGTTMAPGYTDEDFTLGGRDELLEAYPERSDLIRALTRT